MDVDEQLDEEQASKRAGDHADQDSVLNSHLSACRLAAKPKRTKVAAADSTTDYDDVLWQLRSLKLAAGTNKKEDLDREAARVSAVAKETASEVFRQDFTTPIQQPRFVRIYNDTLEQPKLNKHLQ